MVLRISQNYVGIDYHLDTIQVCILDDSGKKISNKSLPNDISELINHCESKGSVQSVALESCTGASSFAHELNLATGWSVDLCHPGYVSKMKQNPDKTDYADAQILADLQRVGYLPKVWLAPEAIMDLRVLVRSRYNSVQDRKRTKQRIKSLLRQWRIDYRLDFGLWTKKGLEWLEGVLERDLLRPNSRYELCRLLDCLKGYNNEIQSLTLRIEEVLQDDFIYQRLMSIKGLGVVTSATMRVEIGDFGRFYSSKHLSSFCGVCPRNCSSGKKQYTSGLVKSGNPILKNVIIESVHRLVRYDKKWSSMYNRLLKKGKHKCLAIGAVANRWIRCLYHEMIEATGSKLASV